MGDGGQELHVEKRAKRAFSDLDSSSIQGGGVWGKERKPGWAAFVNGKNLIFLLLPLRPFSMFLRASWALVVECGLPSCAGVLCDLGTSLSSLCLSLYPSIKVDESTAHLVWFQGGFNECVQASSWHPASARQSPECL